MKKLLNGESSIDDIVESTIDSLSNLVDSDVIIGNTIKVKEDVYVIPISKLLCAISSCGKGAPNEKKKLALGKFSFRFGVNAGVSVKPIAFLILKDNTFRLLSLDKEESCSDVIYNIPQMADAIKGFIKNCHDKKDCNIEEEK